MPRPKNSVVNKPQSNKEIDDLNTIRCPICGKRQALSNYYRSNSSLYKNNNGCMVFCKECVWNTYQQYYNITQDVRSSVYITCLKFDIPFSESDYEGAMKQQFKDANLNPFKTYMKNINSLGAINSNNTGFDPSGLVNYELNSKNNNYDSNNNLSNIKDIEIDVELTQQEIQVKEDIIRLMGYDPFDGYHKFDQKFLYNELLPYLDEDTLDDTFKLSQIIQLVNNNNQIRKIDLVIANMSNDTKSLIANHGDIKSLSQTKNTIVQSTDKIAKENSISVKNRGDKTAGKSTLTYMMKNYRELGFEDAEQDYYDQKKAYGMKLVADISHRSILDQLQLDENDINDIFTNQRNMLSELQAKILEVEEENRQLHEKVSSLSLTNN